MKVYKENGRIILLQKTRLWFRAAVCLWAMVVLATPFMIYDAWFGSQTAHFACNRATGVCEVDGRSKDVPPLADIKSAQIDRDFNRRDGANYGIALVTRDGKKYPIELQRGIRDSVVADYRSAVRTINAYLANPAEQKLDVSYTFVAALSEKLQSIFYFFFGIVTLAIGFSMWTTRRYIFEREEITLMVGGPFHHDKRGFATQRISAIVDHQVANERRIEVKVDGDNRFAVVSAAQGDASKLDQIRLDLAEFLGKPVEKAAGW